MLLNIISWLGAALLLLSFIAVIIVMFIPPLKEKAGLSWRTVSIPAISGILLFSVQFTFFYAAPGISYLVQYPWGTQKAVLTPGFKPRWFGEAIPFKKFLTVAFTDDGDDGKFSGAMHPQEVRFYDSVTATVEMTARFELPSSEEQFLPMAVAYRSQANLINATLMPTMQESMRNAARMFSAQEYVGGRGGDFENAVLDQIEFGIYLLDVADLTPRANTTTITDDDDRTIEEGRTVQLQVTPRIDRNTGEFVRKNDRALSQFGIRLSQANVSNVDPDPVFKDKLTEQREAAAQVAIERQKTRQEEERRLRILAQGETEKAEKRVELEKRQIEITLAAETEAKKAEQIQRQRVTESTTLKRQAEVDKERAAVELETARLEAEKIKTLADAEAEARRLIIEADDALQARLDAYVAVASEYASALTNKQLVPEVVVMGGNGGEGSSNATDLIELLTARAARDLGVAVREGDRSATPAQ